MVSRLWQRGCCGGNCSCAEWLCCGTVCCWQVVCMARLLGGKGVEEVGRHSGAATCWFHAQGARGNTHGESRTMQVDAGCVRQLADSCSSVRQALVVLLLGREIPVHPLLQTAVGHGLQAAFCVCVCAAEDSCCSGEMSTTAACFDTNANARREQTPVVSLDM